MRRLSVCLLWICACTPPTPSPFFGDEAYLRFGTDPRAEADAIVRAYAQQNEVPALRLEGRHFTALGLMTRSGRSTRVRVVTDRGIQLALDPVRPDVLHKGESFALLDAPIANTQDADGDGFEDVFVERRFGTQVCLQIYHVADVGFVDPVPVSLRVFERDYCPSAVSDIDGDGRVEVLVDVALAGFAPLRPKIRLALWAVEHGFALDAQREALDRWLAAQSAERSQVLADARRRVAGEVIRSVAVELAAIAHVRGHTPNEQVREFDRAMSGLVLDTDDQRWVLAARTTIFQTWNPARSGGGELVHNARP